MGGASSDLSVSQDSAGGVYAWWAASGGFALSYSANGGLSWQAKPVALLSAELLADSHNQLGMPAIAGIEAGDVEAADDAGENDYLIAINSATGQAP